MKIIGKILNLTFVYHKVGSYNFNVPSGWGRMVNDLCVVSGHLVCKGYDFQNWRTTFGETLWPQPLMKEYNSTLDGVTLETSIQDSEYIKSGTEKTG